jgi:hypothetical protein
MMTDAQPRRAEPAQPDPAREFDACWRLYEGRKAAYLARNPDASPDEVEAFCAAMAEEFGI